MLVCECPYIQRSIRLPEMKFTLRYYICFIANIRIGEYKLG